MTSRSQLSEDQHGELERLRRENISLRYQVVAWRALAAEFSAYEGKHEFYDRAEEEKLV